MTERDTGYWVRFALSLQETNPHIVLGDDLVVFLIGQDKRIEAETRKNATLVDMRKRWNELVAERDIEKARADERLKRIHLFEEQIADDGKRIAALEGATKEMSCKLADANQRADGAMSVMNDAHEDLRVIRKFIGLPEGTNDEWATSDLVEKRIAEFEGRLKAADKLAAIVREVNDFRATKDIEEGGLIFGLVDYYNMEDALKAFAAPGERGS